MSGFIYVNQNISLFASSDQPRSDDTLADPTSYGMAFVYRFDKTFFYGGNYNIGTDLYWPRSRMMGADYVNIPPIWDNMTLYSSVYWSYAFKYGGTQTRNQTSGVVLYANGSGVSGANVVMFDAPTGVMVDQTTSDSGGNYLLGSPYVSNTFVYASVPSSNLAGSTLNTVP